MKKSLAKCIFIPIQSSYLAGARAHEVPSPVPDLELLLEVNVNFQVRLTIILAYGIFSRANGSGSSMLKYKAVTQLC